MSAVLQAALDAASAGISVLPPKQDGTKSPDSTSWKSHQLRRAGEAQILEWYKTGRTGVGWVTGKISGNLEVIDFDDRSTFAEYRKLCDDAGLTPLLERIGAGYAEHTPNGAHIPYRCDVIEGNQKLAQRADRKALIETRGEGGFIIVAPSHGGVNLKGAYELISGSVRTIAKITPEERRSLFDVARIFDETAPVVFVEPAQAITNGNAPGSDYNARADVGALLTKHGWTRVGGRLGVTSWRRPGKEIGTSATLGHAGTNYFYPFTTSTQFEANRAYSPFAVYAYLEHNGDFGAAARALYMEGYGVEQPEPPSDVDLSLFLSNIDGKSQAPVVSDYLRVPGLVGELAEHINNTSHKLQPVLALGASIAAVGTILGRKVCTETNMRTNLYVLGVGETGCGKERAREVVKQVFTLIGSEKVIGSSFASDSAVERAVMLTPVCLYLIDELGHLLGKLRGDSPSYQKGIIPVLLSMYSSSESVYIRRLYASVDPKSTEATYVDQPCLSIYGTTVPSNLYSGLTKDQISDGFIGRLLVFESADPDPEYRRITIDKRAIPSAIIEGFNFWRGAKTNTDEEAGNIQAVTVPSPLVIKATQGALAVFADLDASMRARRKQEREAGRDHGPFTRVVATAEKLALIRACGINYQSPEITEADASWGASLAWGLVDGFVAKVHGRVHTNAHEKNSQDVLAFIRKNAPVSKSRTTRALTWLKNHERNDIINSLAEGGEIHIKKVGPGGKPTTVYFVGPDPDQLQSN